MGVVKEPRNVDLVVNGSTLTPKDLEKVDEAVSQYKAMGNHRKPDLRRKNKNVLKQ